MASIKEGLAAPPLQAKASRGTRRGSQAAAWSTLPPTPSPAQSTQHGPLPQKASRSFWPSGKGGEGPGGKERVSREPRFFLLSNRKQLKVCFLFFPFLSN